MSGRAVFEKGERVRVRTSAKCEKPNHIGCLCGETGRVVQVSLNTPWLRNHPYYVIGDRHWGASFSGNELEPIKDQQP